MTKEQWLEMWASIRKIEDVAKLIPPIKAGPRIKILEQVAIVKKLIQDETGQLE